MKVAEKKSTVTVALVAESASVTPDIRCSPLGDTIKPKDVSISERRSNIEGFIKSIKNYF